MRPRMGLDKSGLIAPEIPLRYRYIDQLNAYLKLRRLRYYQTTTNNYNHHKTPKTPPEKQCSR